MAALPSTSVSGGGPELRAVRAVKPGYGAYVALPAAGAARAIWAPDDVILAPAWWRL